MIEDVISSFKHLCECSPGPHLIYAHSLGTSIAVEANQQLCLQQAQYQPDGLILDAPLHSVRQEILDYPHGRLMQKMYTKKFFEKIVDYHLTRHNIKFETYKQILDITNPILLLQAEDDKVGEWKCLKSRFSATRILKLFKVDMVVFSSLAACSKPLLQAMWERIE